MNNDLHEHLDGEIDAEALDPRDAAEADAWGRMVAAFRTSVVSGRAPPWLEQRVMTEIEALPEPGVMGRLATWLLRPAPVRVSPLTAGLVMAAFVAVLLLPQRSPRLVSGNGTSAAGTGAEAVVYVQFMLEAPGAMSVAVAGDFNDWQPSFALDDPDGDGVWSGRVPVRPGVHGYMFLIDDTRWQTDPNADRFRDDGFGNRNAVLAVGASS